MEPATARPLERLRKEQASFLLGKHGPPISVVIDESALYRRVGPRDEQKRRPTDELRMVLDGIKMFNTVGRRQNGLPVARELNPNVAIRIAPFTIGYYKAMGYPYSIVQLTDKWPGAAVYLGTPPNDVLIYEQPAQIDNYSQALVDLVQRIPGPEETDGLVDFVAGSLA